MDKEIINEMIDSEILKKTKEFQNYVGMLESIKVEMDIDDRFIDDREYRSVYMDMQRNYRRDYLRALNIKISESEEDFWDYLTCTLTGKIRIKDS